LSPNKPLVGATGTSYGTDAIYIGQTYSTTYPTPNPNGTALKSRMWRLVTNNDVNPANWKFGMMYTDPAGSPISAAPAASSDPSGNIWVFWGTGRLLSPADQADIQTQAFYGIKDPCWNTVTRAWNNTCLTASAIAPSVTLAQLANVTGAVVTTTGTLTGVAGSSTFTSLITAIQGKAGWYFNLTSLLPSNPPTERAITKPTILGGLVLFNSFIPNNADPCALSGSSYTYAVYYLTGTASPVSAIGTYVSGGSTIVLSRTATAVVGQASNIAIHSGQEKGDMAFIQMSTGEVITVSTIPPITAKSGIISWREL
jgi:Tfp pilus tip-associated adhesin PilY1